ncbi:response regulator transcription factor [Paenibacillus fonticola]|uniref:response regulator transcription factor n=1 Tax=Paenibacillus fonticola TaxID=379896 RepID=UPI000362415D|nr:response regulator [Paenibacillus fonticola]
MFNVLLVDDEVFVRKGLQKLIQWEKYKFTVVGEAKNGGEALDMINRLKPDLVITDILMPVLDGLGLIRSVKETAQADPVFAIISGYDDFKYAQQAIRYGVHDYLLKPIDEDEMADTLQKLAITIGQKHLTALTNKGGTVGSILEALIHNNLQEEDAVKYADVLGLDGASGFLYALAEIHIAPGEPLIGMKEFQKILCSCDESGANISVLEQQPGQFGMLLSTERLRSWGSGIPQALEVLRTEISRQLNTTVTIYAGDIADSMAHVRWSYLSANEVLRHKYAEDGQSVILYEQVKGKPLYSFDMNQSIYNHLMVTVEENNKEAYGKMIDHMFQNFRDQRFTPQAVDNSLSRFITGVMEVVKEMHGNDEEQQRLCKLLEGRYNSWSLYRLKECFTLFVTEAADYIAKLRKEQLKGDIEKIKKYIDSHFKENINLKSIAAQFYMNSVYLGQLFRKTYGVYFNEYLLKLRVEEAKRLLRQTDMRMYEIATWVGIRNANYFVSQFEKLEKLSPIEYRNKLVKKE